MNKLGNYWLTFLCRLRRFRFYWIAQSRYLLPTVQYSQFKNSYINRCLFQYV